MKTYLKIFQNQKVRWFSLMTPTIIYCMLVLSPLWIKMFSYNIQQWYQSISPILVISSILCIIFICILVFLITKSDKIEFAEKFKIE